MDLNATEEAPQSRADVTVSGPARYAIFAIGILGLIVVWLFMWGPLKGESDTPPPATSAPIGLPSQTPTPKATPTPTAGDPSDDPQPYRDAAEKYLVEFNTWNSRESISDFQDRIMPLIAPGTDASTSLTTRADVTDPSDECRSQRCTFTAKATLVADEFQQGGAWVSYFQVSVTRTLDGQESPWEDFIWIVKANPGDSRPVLAINTYEASVIED